MNGFIIAGIGVSVGMAMFKDQFSTVFINNSGAKNKLRWSFRNKDT